MSPKSDDYFNDSRLSLEGKHVLVLGFARQGKALARWLPTQGARVTLSDRRNAGELADDILEFVADPNVNYALGGHSVDLLRNADMLCLSGGVPANLPIVKAAYAAGLPVTNDAVLFMERCPARVIGITGSAGKTTTTTLVGEIARKAGHKTWVGGNIGNVLLDDLDQISEDDIVVMELSSFQLEIAEVSPPIAALLNITPNHLDRHGTLEAYAKAKSNIFTHQSRNDLLVYGSDDLLASTFAEDARGDRAAFSTQRLVADGACLAGRRLIVTGNCSPTGMAKVVCERDQVLLPGEHNLRNIAAACALAGSVGITPEAMHEVVSTFKGVSHRLEVVATIGDVTWINDSIATSPDRVVAALRSFERPIILLAGGRDKDLPWDEMARLAIQRCRAVICFGEYGPQIAEHLGRARRYELQEVQLHSINTVKTLTDAVDMAAKLASANDIVLLSPGGTSFDAYTDFAERGQHFRKLVEDLQRDNRS
ncbi:MAG: UDP-N-acetylmuramoyl-L-alanine--D-glutamate ligase [Chloroflexi bacterium]|nr:UDP-N-acetylmuramoyl-L-alanine--D-glutamate ligase [Chloroflexota bacterium]